MNDVIVIGSGPGGAITASILAEAGLSVLLLEEGKDIPQKKHKPFSLNEMDTKYRNQGVTVAFGNPKINYVEGQVLGGGSEVNSGLYFPPDKEIIERWSREFCIDDFKYSSLIEHSKMIEDELSISYMPIEPPLASRKLAIGAKNLGWSSIEVPRWFKYDSNKSLSGTRQSMSETFIPKFLKSGGSIKTKCRVEKIKKNKNSWNIYTKDKQNNNRNILKSKYVFVCCGTIQTPLLLKRSGIKKNIGTNFKIHPTIKVLARFSERVNDLDLGVPVHQVKEFAPNYSFGCAISSKEFLAAGLIDYPEALSKIQNIWKNMASYYAMTTLGNGKIFNLPFGLGDFVNYKLSDADLRVLSIALKDLCDLLFNAGAKELFPSIAGMPSIKSSEDIDKIPVQLNRKTLSLMTIHLMASCPMGEDKSKCAVNSYGLVHGYNNLYVADSSILCDGLGYNPQGTTMAIIARNANKFLENISNV